MAQYSYLQQLCRVTVLQSCIAICTTHLRILMVLQSTNSTHALPSAPHMLPIIALCKFHVACIHMSTDLFPENSLSTKRLRSLPKAMDWSCRSHSPPWSQMGQSRGWFTSRNSITPSLHTMQSYELHSATDHLLCIALKWPHTNASCSAHSNHQSQDIFWPI